MAICMRTPFRAPSTTFKLPFKQEEVSALLFYGSLSMVDRPGVVRCSLYGRPARLLHADILSSRRTYQPSARLLQVSCSDLGMPKYMLLMNPHRRFR